MTPALVWAYLAPVAFSATSNPLPLTSVGPVPPTSCGCLYADLGESVRRAAIDLGAILEFSPAVRHITDKLLKEGAYATIAYRSGAVGRLVYLKPWLTADMPADVMAYAAAHSSFPHESTADQFFTESQFESYRHLGAFLGSSAFGAAGSLDDWLDTAARRQSGEENDAP